MSNNLAIKSSQSRLKERIKKLEEELQMLKWDIVPSKTKQSIVDATKGILGEKFPKSLSYQKRMRKDWEKRMQRIGL
jgi:hypothetical protein